jgi:hypothetical protein
MREIANLLYPHMNMSLHMYLAHSGMTNGAVWGTDVELLGASSLLSKDVIYVYTKVGSELKWQKFSISNLDGSHPQNNGAIYIQHTIEIHYDALDVGANEEWQQHVCKRKAEGQTHFNLGNSVAYEPACKRSKISAASKKKGNFVKEKDTLPAGIGF